MSSPKLKPGYAYRADCPGEPTNDDWEIVMLDRTDVKGARYVGDVRIDGTGCARFETKAGDRYAQSRVYTG